MRDREALDAEAVQVRLPDGWRVENDGPGVYGYADSCGPADFLDSPESGPEIPACFAIRPSGDGGLWAATWNNPHELGDARHDPNAVCDRVRGVKERCVGWVVQRARDAEGADR